MPDVWKNKLYFGDNLNVLRDHIEDESVDLVYLDPPFNSNATYNVLFRETSGSESAAQITAFDDTWHWGEEAEATYREVVEAGGKLGDLLAALLSFLGRNDMMAYLTMMAPRLRELHRVLKANGSLYLHCDPTSSHYLKLALDAIFGAENYLNELIWARANAHNLKSRFWPRQHDTLLWYGKTDIPTLRPIYQPYGPEQLKRYKPDENGRMYTGQDLTVSLVRRLRQFEWRGTKPPAHRSWGASEEQLEAWHAEGRILMKKDGTPRLDGLKVYLDETKGKQVGTVWTDIPRVRNTAAERLGYPTQKPEALLERILQASSGEGDLVLDPFCGCGTTIAVAERLHRRWIGIDITHLAITLIRHRLHDTFKEQLHRYQVHGQPTDLEGARALAEADRHKFEWWALGMVDARPAQDQKKGADSGIDGRMVFFDDKTLTTKAHSERRTPTIVAFCKRSNARIATRPIRAVTGSRSIASWTPA